MVPWKPDVSCYISYHAAVNNLKFPTLSSFFFSNKMLVFGGGIHKTLVSIASRVDHPNQSELGLPCLSRSFWKSASVRNIRLFTANKNNSNQYIANIRT